MAHCRSRSLIALLICTAFAVSAGGAAADPGTDVRAKVMYVKRTGTGTGTVYEKVRLTITRNGRTWRSGRLGRSYFTRPKLNVRDLDADGELEVWVDTYTGGAHCCLQTRFFRWLPVRKAYAKTFRDWADAGYRPKNLDGRGAVELLSADARFAYVFTAFAGSPFPIQIWHFDGGRLRNVTQLFPGQVALDAQQLWSAYLEHRRKDDVRGVLAAWLADEYLLGREDEGWLAIETALKRGDLQGPNGTWPTGRRYVLALRAFLKRNGYA
jgi:hypothetical protein